MATLYLVLSLVLVVMSSPALAETYYVRDGGSSSSCTGWSTASACDQITTAAALAAGGDTIFVADGTYTGLYLNNSHGTSYITIRKAVATGTVNDDYPSGMTAAQAHGTDTGWDSSYGDGQATIGESTVLSSYWKIDGAKRNESDWEDQTAYGFRVSNVRGNDEASYPSYITWKYCNVGGTWQTSYSASFPDEGFRLVAYYGLISNYTISRSIVHNLNGLAIRFLNVDTLVLEYSWVGYNWSKEIIRGSVRASNVTMRYNILKDGCRSDGNGGEGCSADVALFSDGADSGAKYDGFLFYGNVVIKQLVSSYNNMWTVSADLTHTNSRIYNNTVVHNSDYTAGFALNGQGVIRNNVVYAPNATGITYDGGTVDNNSSYTSSPPFVNLAGGNYHLTGALAGVSLSAPYNYDMGGNLRGADGVWDRGAYEYGTGSATPPTGTVTLSVRSLVWWVLLPIGSLLGLLVAVPLVGGWLIRGVFDGRSDRAGGIGDVGGGEDGRPVRPLAPGAVQARGADHQQPGGENLDAAVTMALEHAGVAETSGSQVMRHP